MAVLRLDEQIQVFGSSGKAEKGPVVYGDRWHINNLILDVSPGDAIADIGLYRNYVAPSQIIMRSAITDFLNSTVNVSLQLNSGEKLVMEVTGGEDPGALYSCHIMGDRLLATASYPSQWTHYGA